MPEHQLFHLGVLQFARALQWRSSHRGGVEMPFHRSRRRAAAVAATVVVTGCLGAPAVAAPAVDSSSRATMHAAPSATVVQTNAPARRAPRNWVGVYHTHAGGLRVQPNGTLLVSYIVYDVGPDGSPELPELQARISKVRGGVGSARVTHSSTRRIPVGTILQLKRTPMGFEIPNLDWTTPTLRIPFCDQAHEGQCGA